MSGKIVIKLGGSLITDKRTENTVNREAVDRVAEAIAEIVNLGYSVILVHGAGSFGHILAKKWSIDDGANPVISVKQREAIAQIRTNMIELCSILIKSLEEYGITCRSFPPSEWATGTGKTFEGDISIFAKGTGFVPVTFGDVVDINDSREFGILSGDDIMLRLANEIEGVSHVIFLIGDAPGVMDRPPGREGSILLERWSPSDEVDSEHNEEIDVTGGIRLKMERAGEIAQNVDDVWIIDGRSPSRILELLNSGKTVGTKIMES